MTAERDAKPSRLRQAAERLPIELRLTLAFVTVMALVLAATGAFVYLRLAGELDQAIDAALRSRVNDLGALVRADGVDSDEARTELTSNDDSFAQILDRRGRVLAASRGVAGRVLLHGSELQRAFAGELQVERTLRAPDAERFRVRAGPAASEDGRYVVVAGGSLESRDRALSNLRALLLIGGPVALALAALAGYGVAAAALRPVEAMRERAEDVALASPGRRLPVPPGTDKLARLGHTLNDMLGRQERAFERERAFVSDASHELRTPLTTLKTELEVALLEKGTREQAFASLALAAEETERLAQLAEDLLVIARADQGRLPVRLQSVTVGELFADVEARFRQRFLDGGRQLVVQAPAGLAIVADPMRVQQALGNLVDNALRHGDGDVMLRAAVTDAHVELHINDQGPGFPRDFLAHAFERFTRADEGRTSPGTGLGLAIVDVIARAHDGRAGATNLATGGADTWLELPRPGSGRPS